MTYEFSEPAPWDTRSKSFDPLPGGYDGYLKSLRRICKIVDDLQPASQELAGLMHQEFEEIQSAFAAKVRESFLRRAGIISLEDGRCHVSEFTRKWLDTGDGGILIAGMHSRVRFVGEMLHELREPLSTQELLSIANSRYGMGWITRAQISIRRGWLQSAKLIRVVEEGRLVTTKEGRNVTARLELHPPFCTDNKAEVSQGEPKGEDKSGQSEVEKLAGEIVDASIRSKDASGFERMVRDAFAFLGFDALWLGGSGKTDVLLDAPLGLDESYRVSVDAKTTGSGHLDDLQVDWDTLEEHRQKHKADYSLLVGPRPKPGRLMERATDKHVAVLSAEELAALCRQHAQAPLGLADYRALFAERHRGEWLPRGGEVDTNDLDEAAEEAARMRHLTKAVLDVLSERCMNVGALKARELWIILEPDEVAGGSSEKEIQGLLYMLAHPLVRAIDGDADSGYVPSSRPAVTRMRLQHLTTAVAPEAVS